jgi:hypothetical protein
MPLRTERVCRMDVKEAVALAKQYLAEVFVGEPIKNLGLEEVEFDDNSGIWCVTIGFSRPWDTPGTIATMFPGQRDYKVVRISDSDKKMISVKNREPVG